MSKPALSILRRKLARTLPWLLVQAMALRGRRHEIVLAVGFSPWKEDFVRRFYRRQVVLFVDSGAGIRLLRYLLAGQVLRLVVWSFKDEEMGLPPTLFTGLPRLRMEDGFVRSLGRGLDHNPPWSLCLDRQGMYFDASTPSDFEDLCNGFEDGAWSPETAARARQAITLLQALAISKYNQPRPSSTASLPLSPPVSDRGAVLVLGQVEDDRSITRNRTALASNRALLARAISDHPDKQVYFKQHPDCLGHPRRPGHVDLATFPTVGEIAASTTMTEALGLVDIVYTISSLGGFEALLQGKQVVTFGSPFYAGWGLTTDHVHFPRRRRKLSLLQLFHVAYILYPTYFNPHTGDRLELENVIRQFAKEMNVNAQGPIPNAHPL